MDGTGGGGFGVNDGFRAGMVVPTKVIVGSNSIIESKRPAQPGCWSTTRAS